MIAVADVLLIMILGTAASAAFVALVRQSFAQSLLDVPNSRSLHTHPTPRAGGIGIVAVAIGGAGVLWATYGLPTESLLAWAVGGLAIASISLVDDVRRTSQVTRLTVQLIAAAGFLAMSRVQELTVGSILDRPVVLAVFVAVGIVWLVGFTNAFNFMDGSDGLAGGVAVMAGAGWVVLGMQAAATLPTVLGALVASASLGFLLHNWRPARIFMGDVGSAFLGFSLAALPLLALGTPRLAVAGTLALWPFVFDTAYTMARRGLNREPLMTAHRTHLYQRLILSGWSHERVATLYMASAAAMSAAASSWISEWWAGGWLCLVAALGFVATILRLVTHSERAAPQPA